MIVCVEPPISFTAISKPRIREPGESVYGFFVPRHISGCEAWRHDKGSNQPVERANDDA